MTAPLRLLFATGAALAGCGQKAEAPVTPPDWRRFTVDGMAPTMTPDQVERALAANGYRPRECVGEPVVKDALRRSNDLICYEAPAKRLNASLSFVQLPEGRRLARLRLSDNDIGWRNQEVARTRYGPFLRTLIARWGPPDQTVGDTVKTRAWIVPGVSPTLPDYVSTAEMRTEGRNIEMTSFWAVQHEVAKAADAALVRATVDGGTTLPANGS